MKNVFKYFLIDEEDFLKYTDIVNVERNKINAVRGYYSMLFGIVVEFLLIIFIDIFNVLKYGINDTLNLYFVYHLLLLFLSIATVYLTRLYRNKPDSRIFKELSFDTLIIIFISIFISLIAMINGIDQLYTSSTSMYMVFVLIVALTIFLPPKKMMIIMLIGHAFFVVGMFVYQSNITILVQNLVNGTINMIVAFIASIVSYNTFFSRIINQTKLKEATMQLETLSNIDPLTNCYNRRFGYNRITEEMSRSNRLGDPMGLLMIDIDDFKAINDQYGHIVGDKVLIEFTSVLEKIFRKEDVLIRYGGEEFVVLLINSGSKETEVVAYKVLREIENHIFNIDDHKMDLTVSIGGTSYPDCGSKSIDELLNYIDQNMYEVKNSGKNDFRII